MIMARRNPLEALPAVLRNPASADRLATELTVAAESISGDDRLSTDRRRFLAGVAVQVESFGSDAPRADDGQLTEYRPALVRDDLETRTG
jgi:hypothetical protein